MYVSRARQPGGMFSMDSVVNTRHAEQMKRRILHILVDEALDVELAQDDPLSRAVETEPALVFVNLALGIFLLGLVLASIATVNEPRI